MPRIIPATCLVVSTLLFVSIPVMAAASGPIKTTKTISAFQRPPNNLNSLAVANDGNLYAASSAQGYLVRVSPDGVFTIIHDFLGDAAGTPNALTLGKDGNLYGLLLSNGSIFKSDLAGHITIVASLAAANAQTTLIHAADGNLYGTTIGGGSANHGSVFKITPGGQVTVIHSFAGDLDGEAPTELIETTPGVFYGICLKGGPLLGSPAIFKVTAEGAVAIVRDFSGTGDREPRNLVFATDGNVYGSYSHPDGNSSGYSIFRLTPAGGFTPLSNFAGSHNITDVVIAGDGNLYASAGGGAFGEPDGTLSRITLSGQVTLLHGFSGQDDGRAPTRLAGGANQVFGVNSTGSIADLGTVFRVDAAGQFATLVRLGTVGEGYSPNSAFLQSTDGSFYGATMLGGAGGYGTLYHVASSGERTTLHEFGGDAAATPTLLISGTDGRLYGASSGIDGKGSVYRVETSGAFTMLHQFSDGDDGLHPVALVASHDGNIYGIATSSLSSGKYGSFFRITPAGTFSLLKVFDKNLSFPVGLVEAKDGNLYGLASSSGAVLFQIAPGNGSTTIIHSFSGDPIGGSFALVAGMDGNLYGTASGMKGPYLASTGGLWRCSPAGTFTLLHAFDGSDNIFSPTRLVSAANGDLYGEAGSSSGGDKVVYRFTAGGGFEPLYNLSSLFDLGLIEGTDGNIYGTTGNNTGPLGGGALIKFVFGKPSAVNLATRMKVGTGNNVSIGGFIVTGNVAKKVLLRGIGPSLSLAGKLDNPMLELHDAGGTIIGQNDNWRVSQPGGVVTADQSTDIKASGLAPIDDREAALIASLPPGNYTAVLSGAQDTVGIGLVEIYDLDAEADATLANISTRGFADTGDNVLIGGFITDGSSYGLSKLIVRALGPSLAQFGVVSPLNNPSLSVYDQNGGQLATNGDWQDGNQPEIIAAGLAPSDAHESAVYVVLPGGSYTAVVIGQDGGTGVALVETYNLP